MTQYFIYRTDPEANRRPTMNVILKLKNADAIESAVSYCRCSGLLHSVSGDASRVYIAGNIGSIDIQTLSLYGKVTVQALKVMVCDGSGWYNAGQCQTEEEAEKIKAGVLKARPSVWVRIETVFPVD